MRILILFPLFISEVFVTSAQEVITLHEWTVLDYDWNSFNMTKQDAINSGEFEPTNNCPTGIKVYNQQIYVTVPRWRTSVPSTLNLVVKDINGSSVLQPYPNQWFNNLSNPNGIKYTQSMEIDSQGRMWILDVGRSNIFADDPSQIINGSAKIILWDIENNIELDRYIIPDDVADPNGNFLNDLVIDESIMTCYISDAGRGSIVTVDLINRRSSFFQDLSTLNDPSVSVVISGIDYGNTQFTTPEDGIALTPDKEYVYYCPLQDLVLYRIPSSILRQWPFNNEDAQKYVEIVGTKSSPADGMVFTASGVLYSGGIADPDNNVWFYNASNTSIEDEDDEDDDLKETIVASDIFWADTFAFDDEGNLLFTENHLNQFLTYTMDFASSSPNFSIKSVYVGDKSYVDA